MYDSLSARYKTIDNLVGSVVVSLSNNTGIPINELVKRIMAHDNLYATLNDLEHNKPYFTDLDELQGYIAKCLDLPLHKHFTIDDLA
jgi:hypothetical protein